MSASQQDPGQPFSPMAVLGMVLVGVFAFSAIAVLSAYAPDLRGGLDGGAHALSHSAVGYAGVTGMLLDEGQTIRITRRAQGGADPDHTLQVLTPDVDVSPRDLQAFLGGGPVLIVLPKWIVQQDPQAPGWVDRLGVLDPSADDQILARAKLQAKLARRSGRAPVVLSAASWTGETLPVGPVDSLQTLTLGQGLVPLIVDPQGNAVLAATADRKLMVLSDPDLMNNQGLKDIGAAYLAQDVLLRLRPTPGLVAFDVSLNGFGSPPSLLKLALQPPFLGATLCLVAALILIGLQAAMRFGAPTPVPRALAFGKRALADSAAALIHTARREPRMARRYVELTRQAVARALGVRRLGEAELDEFLDRAAASAGAHRRLAELSAEAETVRTRAALLDLAHRLYQWRLEMTRERG